MNNPEQKTPRDWLLALHATMTPQLDALRHNALPRASAAQQLRELAGLLFGGRPRFWTAIAATWAVLLLLHLTVARTSRPTNQSTPPPQAIATWLAEFNRHGNLFTQNDRRP